MKKYGLIAAAVLLCGVMAIAFASENVDFSKEQKGLLRHVVSFKFKDGATPEQIQEVVDAFAALEKKIPFIVDFECGTNVSPEGLTKGFTHCFIATFKSAKDRDAYLPHPEHKAFGKLLGPILDDVMVIDFWTK